MYATPDTRLPRDVGGKVRRARCMHARQLRSRQNVPCPALLLAQTLPVRFTVLDKRAPVPDAAARGKGIAGRGPYKASQGQGLPGRCGGSARVHQRLLRPPPGVCHVLGRGRSGDELGAPGAEGAASSRAGCRFTAALALNRVAPPSHTPQPVIGMTDTLNATGTYTLELPTPRTRTSATIRRAQQGQQQ